MKKMKFKAVELKYLDEVTIKNIRVWRNQKFIADQMFTQHEIGEEEHQRWIDAVRKDENRHLFVFYLDDQPFAVVQSRYDPQHDYVETGDYLISEEYQAMGYGTILRYFISQIMFDYLGYEATYGEVLGTNQRSLKNLKKINASLKKVNRDIDGKSREIYILLGDKKKWEEEQNSKLQCLVYKFVEKEAEIIL